MDDGCSDVMSPVEAPGPGHSAVVHESVNWSTEVRSPAMSQATSINVDRFFHNDTVGNSGSSKNGYHSQRAKPLSTEGKCGRRS